MDDTIKKGIMIIIGIIVGLPLLIYFLIKKPFIIVAILIIGAIILLPVIERKIGL